MLSKDMDAIPRVPYAMARLGVPGGLGKGKSKASDRCLVKHCGCICCPARAAVRRGVHGPGHCSILLYANLFAFKY